MRNYKILNIMILFWVMQYSSLSANISVRIKEIGLTRPQNPQLPRGFADVR
jgi:hypothetical protein